MRRSNRKEMKREEALERQKAWEALSFEQQLASLDERGHRAEKQRARIAEAIKKRDANSKKKSWL